MATSPEMNRKDFLQLFGFGATALLASACLGGCGSKAGDPNPVMGASNVDFMVDLTAASSAPLNDPAVGYVYNATRDVIVAKTAAGGYIALQAPCTHNGTSVYFAQSQNRFICPNHNAVFDVGGAVLGGPAPQPLKKFAVAQTGTSLRITG